MRLLVFTQVLDRSHSDLGFFHAWIQEFAKQCDRVIVVCLFEGDHSLPPNVTVLSLGKEKGASRVKYLFRFLSYLFKINDEYDAVLVHMNPEYLLLGGIFWRIMRKPVGLWYVHKHVGLKLRVATFFSRFVFTVSPESFRLKSTKVKILGHGIDISLYEAQSLDKINIQERQRILMLGRVSPSKRIDVGIELLKFFVDEKVEYELVIVGEPMGSRDEEYLLQLQKQVEDNNRDDLVSFAGGVAHSDTRKHYRNAHVFLHTSETGSVDKVVLEALASGLPVVSTSEAFKDTPGVVYVEPGDISELAVATRNALSNAAGTIGVEYVRTNHSLPVLVTRILSYLRT